MFCPLNVIRIAPPSSDAVPCLSSSGSSPKPEVFPRIILSVTRRNVSALCRAVAAPPPSESSAAALFPLIVEDVIVRSFLAKTPPPSELLPVVLFPLMVLFSIVTVDP